MPELAIPGGGFTIPSSCRGRLRRPCSRWAGRTGQTLSTIRCTSLLRLSSAAKSALRRRWRHACSRSGLSQKVLNTVARLPRLLCYQPRALCLSVDIASPARTPSPVIGDRWASDGDSLSQYNLLTAYGERGIKSMASAVVGGCTPQLVTPKAVVDAVVAAAGGAAKASFSRFADVATYAPAVQPPHPRSVSGSARPALSDPTCDRSFLTETAKCLTSLGLDPDKTTVTSFLNRILGLPPTEQNLMFGYFLACHDAEVTQVGVAQCAATQCPFVLGPLALAVRNFVDLWPWLKMGVPVKAKRDGRYSGGVHDIPGETITFDGPAEAVGGRVLLQKVGNYRAIDAAASAVA